MKYTYLLLFGFLVLMAQSCKKDHGNYTYKDLNEVTIKTNDTAFVIQQLETLKISPALTETIPGDSYTYAWTIYLQRTPPTGVDHSTTLISTEKDLNKQISNSPNDYWVLLTVTNEKTKIKAFQRYSVTVSGAFYDGWLVTSNKNGKAMVSFVRKDNAVFYNPINEINNIELKGKALGAYSGVISRLSQINVFTDSEVYRLNADDFIVNGTHDNLFGAGTKSFEKPFYTVNSINTDQYIVDKGSVHATITPNFGPPGKYSERFAGPDGNYEAFPYFMSGSRFYAVFYDNLNQRFLNTDYNSRTLYTFANFVGAAYDLNNVGKTMIAGDTGPGNEYYLIMKDETDYYFYTFIPKNASPAGVKQPILNSPEIKIATSFASSTALKQMYYAAGKNLYVYDVLANNSRKVYEFPAGTNIKDVEMLKSKGWGKADPLFNNRLVVATYNGTEGELYYFNLTSTGDIEGQTFFKKFSGFGDIVQINYRNPNV
ncbi:MAG: PKD-like family lipoprotein [Ginsengibacter sp.]